ncbi:arylsulfatase A-like enzyme [Chitinophaga dinghuensis]|uniref:Arylsulfatase A-like enzyme n=1 Tax=Chitinophaga dinghuensis TaxID=1539050 RepID=A0A327WBT1_9BACT|nr:arylsulfatase [Chitinophaga dinghuensis]RAJ88043.1 arylsulfatase A-like enzyme [Chitinophaga dinghuensis]
MTFLRKSAGVALLGAALLHTAVTVNAQKKQPNIIFILADDLGYGDLSSYGQQKFSTPHIDQLSKEGKRFTQFYAGTSVCAPSRCSFISGKHTGHTFVRGNKEIRPEGQQPIADSVVTLTEVLKTAGYKTGAFGKWGLGPVGSEGDPIKQGIDQFYGYNCQMESHRYYPTHLWSNDDRVELTANGQLEHTAQYAPEIIQEQALKFMETNKNQPFFLYLAYTLPHAELIAPEDSILARFKGTFPEKPYKGAIYGPEPKKNGYVSQEYPHATFAAMVTRLDMYVGQVMAKLKELGLDDNTLVIFTSDNGPHAEGGADPAFFNSSGNLRGIKRDLYEGGIRVPFIARWQGKIKAGSVSNYTGAFWDMMPTFADLAGVKTPQHIDGISIVRELTGKKKQAQHPFLYWEFHENGGRQAVRRGNWKAVKMNVTANPAPGLELYDLSVDPAEQHNVAAANPEIVKQMQAIIDREHVESTIFPLLKK